MCQKVQQPASRSAAKGDDARHLMHDTGAASILRAPPSIYCLQELLNHLKNETKRATQRSRAWSLAGLLGADLGSNRELSRAEGKCD